MTPADAKKVGVTAIPVSVDIVLLTIKDDSLHVALARREASYRNGELALIGATVNTDRDEHLGETVQRILEERGGLNDIFVEQLYTFGSRTRDERGWSLSVSYYGLIPMHMLEKASKALEFYQVDNLLIYRSSTAASSTRLFGVSGARVLIRQFRPGCWKRSSR